MESQPEKVRLSPKPVFIRGLFTRIAGVYDRLNRMLTFGLDVLWRRRALARFAVSCRKGGRIPSSILDVATGTADLAIAAARRFPAARVTGVDLTPAMLDVGRRKVAAADLADRVSLREGDVLALPFPAGSFGAVMCAFGFRNFADPAAALCEVARVLEEDGRLLVLELFRPKSCVLGRFVSWWLRSLSALFAGKVLRDYAYLDASIGATLSAAEFVAEASRAGFVVEWKNFCVPACTCLQFKKVKG